MKFTLAALAIGPLRLVVLSAEPGPVSPKLVAGPGIVKCLPAPMLQLLTGSR